MINIFLCMFNGLKTKLKTIRSSSKVMRSYIYNTFSFGVAEPYDAFRIVP